MLKESFASSLTGNAVPAITLAGAVGTASEYEAAPAPLIVVGLGLMPSVNPVETALNV